MSTPETQPKLPLNSFNSVSMLVSCNGEKPSGKVAQCAREKTGTSVTAHREHEAGKVVSERAEGKPGLGLETPGLLVTAELLKVMSDCRRRVEAIAIECRASNTKYRDLEFDILNEEYMCLYNVNWRGIKPQVASDKQRVTEIFDTPTFFKSGGGSPSSDDIRQGHLGDCWFLCALATISKLPHLVQQVCVARDEEVGVYGFIFYRDDGWVSVIIDDILFTNAPKWEELTSDAKNLYSDKEQFNKISRKGSEILTFAKSGANGETWVPLIEKAYAKFVWMLIE
ncbi:hypothetical protein NMY22_g12197 [Coprinellus aureogranulatus]|nr:hypothetical protein NMY22_g12197 [Coprinellus aureogranulatus]